ncbi:MAG: class I SAM-dependent methyltransferase [Eubacteriales bacterium]|nr:class I SAM-dependent methyltransferase [Eubacteriales bacterium]
MENYENFAGVYDALMDNVPYEAWADCLQSHLARHGIKDGLMLELGCGTGKMMALMAQKGFDMIGVDSSVDMLQIARERTQNLPGSFLYLLQDMRDFELYGTVASVISVCDSVNYVTSEEELRQVFSLVNNYLDPGGLFIFDFNTEHKYRDVIGERVIAEDREEVSFIWYNEYDDDEHINYIDLSLFVQEDGNLYRKFQEEHVQRGYGLSQIKRLMQEAGLVFLEAFDGYTKEAAKENSERIVCVAREHGKEERE